MNQPAPPSPQAPGLPAGPDGQLAGWLDAAGLPSVIGGMTDVKDLAATATRLAEQHDARHVIRSVRVWPLINARNWRDDALVTVDPPHAPRLATLAIQAREFTGLTPRQALGRLLDLARAQTNGLAAYLETGGQHHDHARLKADLAELAEAAASLDEMTLGDLVHDAASRQASNANNDGLESQVELLARIFGPERALALIRDAAGE